MTNANPLTTTNSQSSLDIQAMIPALNLPLLQSMLNPNLLQSKEKNQQPCCRQARHHLPVIG